MWELVENKISIFSCCQHLTLQGILSLLHRGWGRLVLNPIKSAHLDFFLENQGKKSMNLQPWIGRNHSTDGGMLSCSI